MNQRKGLLLAVAAFSCWGLLSPGNEILLREWTPMWMQVFRGGVAMVLLGIALGRKGLDGVIDIMRQPALLSALIWGTLLSFGFFVMAQTRIEATFATLGFYISPVWAALLGRFMLGERMGWSFAPAVAVMLGGGYLALTGGGTLPAPDFLGILFALAAGATWAVYAVLLRRESPDVNGWHLLYASTVVGTVGFLIAAATTEPVPNLAIVTGHSWFWMAIQIAIPTLLALGLFQAALRHAPAGQVTILVGFELGATVLFAWWLLDATFSAIQLVGLALVLVSVSVYLIGRVRLSDDSGHEQDAHAEQ